MNKAFIFDMDGTMIDNMMVHHYAWQKRLEKEGLYFTIEQVMANCHGKNDETIQRLFPDKYTKAQRDVISNEKEATYRSIFRDDLKLIDGLKELLDLAMLMNIPMGIGTAANIENVDFVLDELSLRKYFKVVLCERDVNKGKPDPEVFLKVAELMNIEPNDALVFEDSPVGAEAARRAGMRAVILTTTHKLEEFEKFPNVIALVKDYKNLNMNTIFNQLQT